MSILNARRPPLASPLRPTWTWDFARYGRVPPGATYTGNSGNGTYVNSAGVITASTNNSPRFDYDPATLSPLGYLAEMADNNVCAQSNNFSGTGWVNTSGGTGSAPVLTANDAISPDGTQNATKVVLNTGAGTTSADQSLLGYTRASVLTATSNYGASIYVKGTAGTQIIMRGSAAATYTLFTLTGGWDRLSTKEVAASTTASIDIGLRQGVVGTINSSATIWVYGAMHSGTAGVGVTSYIPTAGSTVTRAQDVLSLPLTSLPGWSATQGGVLVAAYRLHTTAPGDNQIPACIDDGTAGNRVLPKASRAATGVRGYTISSGSSNQFDQDAASGTSAFARTKLAVGWGTARGQLYADGALLVATSAAASLPVAPTTIRLGNSTTTGNLNGTLESIAYYRGARSDAFVQAVSR